MILIMPHLGAHPTDGEEVMVVDDVDVDVCRVSISSISSSKERMGGK